jgi:hypothetical protein
MGKVNGRWTIDTRRQVMEKFTRAFGSRFVEIKISKFGIICLDPGKTEQSEDLTRGL